MSDTTITILGAGYVGLTTAALLAHANYKVYVVEPNIERLNVIKEGRSFFYEQGLDPVIRLAIDSGSLTPTDSYEECVPLSQVIFSCVGTPDNPDGSSNLTYVFAAAKQTAGLAEPGTLYVQKSTVPVGTGRKIEAVFKQVGADIEYVSNPEFLRESTALSDTLFFDRVVVGGNNKQAVSDVIDIYMNLEQYREHIAHLAHLPISLNDGQYISTSLNSAELIKVTANAFLALKISFANSIAQLADKADADVVEVMNAVGADNRIGRAFLNAGRGYGGGCFPKDVSGLIASGLEYGVDLDIVQATKHVNDLMPGYTAERIKNVLGELNGKRICILGLAFKSDTSDARRSPGVAIANLLVMGGASVSTYDPKASTEASHELLSEIHIAERLNECLSESDAIVITTDWQIFRDLSPSDLSSQTDSKIVVDAVNCLDKQAFVDAGFTYIGIGR